MRDARADLAWGAVLLVAVAAVFGQVAGHAFITWDDVGYVTGNPRVLDGLSPDGARWAATSFAMSNWHPLTWLAHQADVSLWGTWAGGHHLTSVAFHAANALLLYGFLTGTTGERARAGLVALLFAVHPLHVESVAWVSERKDVLSTFFWLATMLAYARYARQPGAGRYAIVMVLFALGLAAKPMLVTLPCVLLLLDAWPLRRWPGAGDRLRGALRLAAEKLPLIALAALSSWITVLAQSRGGALRELELVPLGDRLANAVIAYAGYLGRALWPTALSYFDPYRRDWEPLALALALAALLAASGLALRFAVRRPALAVGWLWYLGTLVPVIGLVQVGDQASANRYTYIPLIGIFIALAWCLPAPRWRGGSAAQRTVAFVAGVTLLALGLRAHGETGYWKDSETLYRRALVLAPDNTHAHTMLADELFRQGRLGEAQAAAGRALELGRGRPIVKFARMTLGHVAAARGDTAQAREHYAAAAAADPRYAFAHHSLGMLALDQRDYASALAALETALRLAPSARNHNAVGVALASLGRVPEALDHYRAAVALEPHNPEARFNHAQALEYTGRSAEAIAEYRALLARQPRHEGARMRLARLAGGRP